MIKKEKQNKTPVLRINPSTLQYDYFDSINEASRNTNLASPPHIHGVCNNNRVHSGGYYWKYLKDFIINNKYLKCYKISDDILNNKFQCTPFHLLNNLNNYLQPIFSSTYPEIWKNILGYENVYKVSNFGRIISVINTPYIKELNQYDDKDGYKYVSLYDKNHNPKNYRVHRLVAITFIPNPNNLPIINHKDEIRFNNFVDNLEWCTIKYNNNYGSKQDIGKKVQQINLKNGEIINEFKSIAEASRYIDTNYQQISAVCNGRGHSAKGYFWRFVI